MCEPKAGPLTAGAEAGFAPAGLVFIGVFGAVAWAVEAVEFADVAAAATTIAILVALHVILPWVVTATRALSRPAVRRRRAMPRGVERTAPVTVAVTVLQDTPASPAPRGPGGPGGQRQLTARAAPERAPVIEVPATAARRRAPDRRAHRTGGPR